MTVIPNLKHVQDLWNLSLDFILDPETILNQVQHRVQDDNSSSTQPYFKGNSIVILIISIKYIIK